MGMITRDDVVLALSNSGSTAEIVTLLKQAGILLLAGVQVRWVALLQLPVLLGALVVHGGNGWMFSNANGGWEFPAFWAVAQVILALLGDGAAALWPSISFKRDAARL